MDSIGGQDAVHHIAEAEEHLLANRYREAASIYKLLAASGNTFAKIQLGYFCENGLAESKNILRAAEYYQSAMRDGSDLGAHYFSFCLAKLKREQEAFEVTQGLADKGYLPGIDRLGTLYEEGTGCEQNIATAFHYKSYAARNGSVWAKRWLAQKYCSGDYGVIRRLYGVVLYAQAALSAFWLTWRSPGDPRIQG